MTYIVRLHEQLSAAVGVMVGNLATITLDNVSDLQSYFLKFDSHIRFLLEPKSNATTPLYILWLGHSEVWPRLTGNKAANV